MDHRRGVSVLIQVLQNIPLREPLRTDDDVE